MLRRCVIQWCAAAAKPAAEAAPAKAAAAPADGAATPAAEAPAAAAKVVDMIEWRHLPFHSWQTNLPATAQQPQTAPDVFFHGTTLGPFPLMVLGNAGEGSNGITSHAPWLSHVAHTHGALSVPMQTSAQFLAAKAEGSNETDDDSYINKQCHAVARAMDLHGLQWTHFVTHSVGALVAAKMSWLYPEKVGSIVLLDTPLFTKKQLQNEETRAELIKARLDINTPQHLLDVTTEELQDEKEGIVSSCGTSEESATVYSKHIFPEDKIFAEGGAIRDDTPYFLNTEHLTLIRHPALLISPKQGGIADGAIHKAKLNLRKHQVIASAGSHEQLFAVGSGSGKKATPGGAIEVAQSITQWIERFDIDAMMNKKWQQGIKDLRDKMPEIGAASNKAAPESDKKGKKKKKGKK